MECLKRILRFIILDEIKSTASRNTVGGGFADIGGLIGHKTIQIITECRNKVCDILSSILKIKSDGEINTFLKRLIDIATNQDELKRSSKSNVGRKSTTAAPSISMKSTTGSISEEE